MRPIDDDDDDDDDELGDAAFVFLSILFLPPTLLTACPAPPRIGSGRVLRLSSSECPPRWTAPTGDSWNSDAIASFFSSSEEDEDAEDPAARAFPSSSTVSSMTADLSPIYHHHHHRRHHHHRFVLVLARGKRLSVFPLDGAMKEALFAFDAASRANDVILARYVHRTPRDLSPDLK